MVSGVHFRVWYVLILLDTRVHTQSSLSIFTMLDKAVLSLLNSGMVVRSWNSPFIFTRPILVLSSMDLLTCLPTSDQGMDKLTTWHNVQIMPRLHCNQSIVVSSQWIPGLYHISKVLIILKWQTILRKQLEKQRIEPLCSLWGTHTSFFSQCYCKSV